MLRKPHLSIPLAIGFAFAVATAMPAAAETTSAEAPLDFAAELQTLSAIAACDGRPFDKSRFSEAVVRQHCSQLATIATSFKNSWLSRARPFFAELVPKDIPTTVVYPFGGADLVTALTVFPDLAEITILSLESGSDPRKFMDLKAAGLTASLSRHREYFRKLVAVNHSRTLDLRGLEAGLMPSQLVFALIGLAIHGYEPVSLRYFRIEPDGSMRYLTQGELSAVPSARTVPGAGNAAKAQGPLARRNALFANFEVSFRAKPDAPLKVFRHISVNLDDQHLKADPRVIRHLEKKGKVTAITKAASYLLWWNTFAMIRKYLADHIAWMVSDSTGIPPNLIDPSVFELTAYGQFDTTLFKGSKEGELALRKLFASQPPRKLPFRFGYPTKTRLNHLLVTRRR